MKIVLAGETYYPDVNGAAVFTQRLASGLALRGHEVCLIVPSSTSASYELVEDGVHIYAVPSWQYPWHSTFHLASLRARRSIRVILTNIKPDIVHLQAHFIVGRFASAESSKLGIPLIATNHFMPANLRTQIPFPIPNWLFRMAARSLWIDFRHVLKNAIVVTSPTSYAARLVESESGISDVKAISCGVDIRKFAAKERGQRLPFNVLFVGRLDAEKHVDQIIDALTYTDPRIRLRIVGIGSQERRLKHQVKRCGLIDRVDFLGYAPDEKLQAEYSQADVFCMPGTAELQSIATLEAMAAGLPIVAADSHALPELVRPHINGELFTSGNVQELAGVLMRLFTDDHLRAKYGRASSMAIMQHRLSNTLDEFEAIYSSLKRKR